MRLTLPPRQPRYRALAVGAWERLKRYRPNALNGTQKLYPNPPHLSAHCLAPETNKITWDIVFNHLRMAEV